MPTAPVLDDTALQRLGEELGDIGILRGFLRRYIALLDQRIDRVEHTLRAGDHDDWMDAVLSLKTSSSQACAIALAERAADLQQESAPCPSWSVAPGAAAPTTATPATTVSRPPARMACLRRLAAETAHQLRSFLQQADGPGRPS